MVDVGRLPSRVMLDTNVLSFVHGPSTGRVEEGPSKELWLALVAHKRGILIAAPTLGETIRAGQKVPLVSGTEVISFDRRAATLLGGLPMSVLKTVQVATGVSLTHLKYDALIIACAVRGTADMLVTYDSDMAKLQKQADSTVFGKLQIVNPDYFQVAAAAAAQFPAPPSPATVSVQKT